MQPSCTKMLHLLLHLAGLRETFEHGVSCLQNFDLNANLDTSREGIYSPITVVKISLILKCT